MKKPFSTMAQVQEKHIALKASFEEAQMNFEAAQAEYVSCKAALTTFDDKYGRAIRLISDRG